MAARFFDDLPEAELIVCDGVGHVPMEEVPVRSARDAAAFLRHALDSPRAADPPADAGRRPASRGIAARPAGV